MKLKFKASIFIWTFIVSIMGLPVVQIADAHAYSASYTTLTLTKSHIEMTYALDELSVIELTDGDTNGNGMLEQEEFDAIKTSFEDLLKTNIKMNIDGTTQSASQSESLVLNRKGDATQVVLKLIFPAVKASQQVSLIDPLYADDTKTNYVNLVTINYGDKKTTAALSGGDRTWTMMLTESDFASLHDGDQQQEQVAQASQSAEQASSSHATESESSHTTSGWLSFFKLGINHILTGYDHLLFLFSLLIARQSFKQYASMITAFTIAHSITLSLTVLGYMNVPPFIVEPAIAISICVVAVDNIVRKQVSHRWVLTFLFGLIHGMGFADILKEMNLPKSELAVDLLSFNLGIESVQLLMILVLLPLLTLMFRWKYARSSIIVGSSIAFLLGAMWLIERVI
ncbi:hypothetical protein BVG16_26090 [Paenibacillus selenitireducens]|uniref:EF-hand domain-containing protein n=1 Tax=Paenibacillus selenitireducens TaxID=1324314 RepID=A0A1T2X216_9BACL|nr:HupE/UreJ family protein [Paenibacillus selenitireducens]OPA73914.1 hypothetical protein BVG16_26090 [Paenibacillus selenitireducens]